MLIDKSDVQVFQRKRGVGCVRMQFFDHPVKVTRKPASAAEDQRTSEIYIDFGAGGRVTVFTDRPLLWVEPERH